MTQTSVRRRAGAAVAAAILPISIVGLTAAPAEAGSTWFSRSSGQVASVDFFERGDGDTVYYGALFVEDLGRGAANVWGYIDELDCAGGEPAPEPGPAPAGDGDGDGDCSYVGSQWIENGSTTFTMDRKFTAASLVGTLNVYPEDGTPTTENVDLTWTGAGDLYRSVESGRYSDGSSTYSYRYSFTGRNAEVAGSLGDIGIGDEDGEYAYGQMGSFRNAERGRTS